MSGRVLRTAVIGVGYLGRFHAQKHQKVTSIELVGICDVNKEQLNKVGDELQVNCISNPGDLIGKVDAVTIAAATSSHYALAKLFITSGVHVLVEKPLAATSSQAEELCDLAEKHGVVLQVGHLERFNRAFCRFRQLEMRPLFLESRRMTDFRGRGGDVSVVHDLMIHDIDLIQLVAGDSGIRKLQTFGTSMVTGHCDCAEVFLEFSNGVKAHLAASRVHQQPERKLNIFVTGKWAEVNFATSELIWTLKNSGEARTVVEKISCEPVDAILAETEAFVDTILYGKTCACSGREALQALVTVEHIFNDITA